MGLRTRPVGLGATTTAAGLVGWLACGGLGASRSAGGRIRSSRRGRGAVGGSSARLVAAPLRLLGFLGSASV
jgi:hypothetical protein